MLSRLSLPGSQSRIGTLGTIAAVADGLPSPSVIVIGDVVALAEHARAFIAAGS